jgi:hypothetical protein
MCKPVERFARKCDECGKGTNVGYYAEGTIYCTETCLNANITPEEWTELYEEGGSDYYYTEWLAEDIDVEFYDAEGNAHALPTSTSAPCPYCKGTGEGDYWTHDLMDTVSFTCHACDGTALVSRQGELSHALREAGDDRAAEYAALYPELVEDAD